MKLYRVQLPEEPDFAQLRNDASWHGSQAQANKAFTAAVRNAKATLVDDDLDDPIGDVVMERVWITELPPRQLALALLNQSGYIHHREELRRHVV